MSARDAIKELFIAPDFTAVRTDIKHIEIETAFDFLDEIQTKEVQDKYMVKLKEAYNQLTAKEAVEALFTAPEFTSVRGNLTHLEIEAAFDLVDEVTDVASKKILMTKLTEAFNQLTGKEMVKDLFQAPEYTIVRDNLTHLEIESAFDVVDEITDEMTKSLLMRDLTEAFYQLSAKEAVKALFIAPEYTSIKAEVSHLEIESAFDLIDEIQNQDYQSQLMSKLTIAYNQLTAKEAVLALYKTDILIIDGLLQDTITNAKNLVDALGESDIKSSLTLKLVEAQRQYDINKTACEAVSNLFDENGNIIESLTQKDIDVAKELVSKVIDPDLKLELETKIEVAQLQLNNRSYIIIKGFETYTGKEVISITIDAPYNLFANVLINGKVLDVKHYTAKEGSTIITLNDEYLKTLENGTYTVSINFTNNEVVNTVLDVKVPKTEGKVTPPTGISTQLITLSLMFVVSASLLFILKRKQEN